MKLLLLILTIVCVCTSCKGLDPNTEEDPDSTIGACKYQWDEYDGSWSCRELTRQNCIDQYSYERPIQFYEDASCADVGCDIPFIEDSGFYECQY